MSLSQFNGVVVVVQFDGIAIVVVVQIQSASVSPFDGLVVISIVVVSIRRSSRRSRRFNLKVLLLSQFEVWSSLHLMVVIVSSDRSSSRSQRCCLNSKVNSKV